MPANPSPAPIRATDKPPRQLRRIGGALTVILVVAGLAVVIVRPEEKKRVSPESFSVSELDRFHRKVSNLSPPLQHLIAELKAGKLIGAQAEGFHSDLQKADEIRRGRE